MWGRAMNVAFGDSCILQCLIGSLCMICKRKKLREKYNIEGGSGCRCEKNSYRGQLYIDIDIAIDIDIDIDVL